MGPLKTLNSTSNHQSSHWKKNRGFRRPNIFSWRYCPRHNLHLTMRNLLLWSQKIMRCKFSSPLATTSLESHSINLMKNYSDLSVRSRLSLKTKKTRRLRLYQSELTRGPESQLKSCIDLRNWYWSLDIQKDS